MQYGMTEPIAVEETMVQANEPELVLYSGFDDATYLRVRPRA